MSDLVTISIASCLFIFLVGVYSHGVVANVSGLCDGGEIEAEKLNLLLMFDQGTNVEFSSKAPLLQNRCYA